MKKSFFMFGAIVRLRRARSASCAYRRVFGDTPIGSLHWSASDEKATVAGDDNRQSCSSISIEIISCPGVIKGGAFSDHKMSASFINALSV